MQHRSVAWSIGVVLACAGIIGGFLLVRGSGNARESNVIAVAVPDTSSWAVNDAFVKAVPYVSTPAGRVAAGILPHHTLVGLLIAAFFRGLEGQGPPSTIVILGPDHGNIGNAYVTTARFSWSTPDGIVRSNQAYIRTFVERGVAAHDDGLIRREHGVSAVIPYIAHQFPDASVVPLAIRGDLRPDKLEQLADALVETLGPDDLLVASVDFSHYKDVEGARTDDGRSIPVVASGDADAVLSFLTGDVMVLEEGGAERSRDADAALDIPVDSPPAISLLLRYAKRRGLSYQQLVSTNSAEFLHDPAITSTTSYLTAYLYR